MKFNVPILKGNNFAADFFHFFADCIDQIAYENQKWPDKITFVGNIGKELIDIINDKQWDFKRFNLKHENSIVDKIIIAYSKPIDQIEDSGYISGDSLHGQTMKGIPGEKTMSSISNHAINTNFRIERKIRPKLEIKLIR